MIPGCEPCGNCQGLGRVDAHGAKCWQCKGTGIQICQGCRIHVAEYTVRQFDGMPQGDPGRLRFACGICVGVIKSFEPMVSTPGFPDLEERKAQVYKMDRDTGLILHRKWALEDKEWDHEGGRSDAEDEELEQLQREFPMPNYKEFVKTVAGMGCKGMVQQPYPCEDLPGYSRELWCVGCLARDLLKQEEEVTV